MFLGCGPYNVLKLRSACLALSAVRFHFLFITASLCDRRVKVLIGTKKTAAVLRCAATSNLLALGFSMWIARFFILVWSKSLSEQEFQRHLIWLSVARSIICYPVGVITIMKNVMTFSDCGGTTFFSKNCARWERWWDLRSRVNCCVTYAYCSEADKKNRKSHY